MNATALPDHFRTCRIRVEIPSFGTIGTIVGILFHYPCWVGVLEPVPALSKWQDRLGDLLDEDDLVIQLRDLESEETWTGSLSQLMLPKSGYAWYELTWRDDRKPTRDTPPSLLERLDQKLGNILQQLLANRHD